MNKPSFIQVLGILVGVGQILLGLDHTNTGHNGEYINICLWCH